MRGVVAALAAIFSMLATASPALAVPALQAISPLSSDYHVADTNVPSATVWLSEPVSSDTFVTVTSSDPGVTVNGGGVTIPTGQSSGAVMITCTQQASSTLTVTLGVEQNTAAVRCLSVLAPIVALDKSFGTAATGEPFTATATSNRGASAVEDPSYRMTVTGANSTTENKFIVAGLEPPVSNPPVSFSYSGANAGADQVQVCLLDGSTEASGCTSYETIAVQRIAAVAAASPGSLDFGSQAIGSQSESKRVTISNAGTVKLILGSASLTGAAVADFQKSADACSGQTLAPGGSCAVDVVMKPTSAGQRSASLVVPSNDPSKPSIETALTGAGLETTPTATTDTSTPASSSAPATDSSPPPISAGVPFKVSQKRDVKTGGLVLTVQLPSRGKATFVAKSRTRVAGRASGIGSGKLVMKLRPGALAKSALRSQRRLAVKVVGTFVPAAGGKASVVTFKATFVRAKR